MLLLFDIDGTLLDTGGAGGAALLDAVEELYGVPREAVPPLELAGATDGGITRDLFAQLNLPHSETTVRQYHECYLAHLDRRLNDPGFAGELLTGVHDLLRTLSEEGGAHLGLLTGNLRHGAWLKLERFGIEGYFADGAFGDDAADRNHLGPIAQRRMESLAGRSFHPEQIIVIGDTPKDIACAHALGARCLAVATGKPSREELGKHAPWMLLDDLANPDLPRILHESCRSARPVTIQA
jgi:phosphoglycolate phosphatase-like HAD superfamily hydrolase